MENVRRSERLENKKKAQIGMTTISSNGEEKSWNIEKSNAEALAPPSTSQTRPGSKASSTANRRRRLEAEKNLALARAKQRDNKEREIEARNREAAEEAVIEAEYAVRIAALEEEEESRANETEGEPSGQTHGSINNWIIDQENDEWRQQDEGDDKRDSRQEDERFGRRDELAGAEKLAEGPKKMIGLAETTSQDLTSALLGRMALSQTSLYFKNRMIIQCTREARTGVNITVDADNIRFYKNVTSCLLARARCVNFNPVTGEPQSPGYTSGAPAANALQITTAGDLKLLSFPANIPVASVFCATSNALTQSTWLTTVC